MQEVDFAAKIHNCFQPKQTVCYTLVVSPGALATHTTVTEVESTLFRLNYRPNLFNFLQYNSNCTLSLISAICIEGLLMNLFGSEMAKRRICSLWGQAWFNCIGKDVEKRTCQLKNISERGEIQICNNRQIMLLCQSKKKKTNGVEKVICAQSEMAFYLKSGDTNRAEQRVLNCDLRFVDE